MGGRTRILTLNSHFHLLSASDKIVVMSQGKIACSGTYQEVQNHPSFLDLTKHQTHIDTVAENVANTEDDVGTDVGADVENVIDVEVMESKMADLNSRQEEDVTELKEIVAELDVELDIQDIKQKQEEKEEDEELKAVKLILDEDRATGAVSLATYQKYYASVADGKSGGFIGGIVVFSFAIAQTVRTLDDVWLAYWVDSFNTNVTNGNPLTPSTEASLWLNMYASFAGGSLILYLLSSGIFVWCAINASKHFHHEVLTTLLKGKKK